MQRMKKWFIILLCIALAATLVACDKKPDEPSKTEPPASTDPAPVESDDPEPGDRVTLENIKIGMIHNTDPSDMGYTYNHDLGTQKMQKELGLRDDQIIKKFNTPEDAECEAAIRELVEQGCNIVFATSFGHEDYMMTVAADHPEVEFCHATGYQCALSDMPNTHNYMPKTYQARYLTGIAAGLKTETNIIGYVNPYMFAECIQAFSAIYLGAKSVNPEVKMLVMNMNTWTDPHVETQITRSLIELGCDVIGHHSGSTASATTAEEMGVFQIAYSSDMIDVAPKASLTSAVQDWSRFLVLAVSNYVEGKPIPKDWSEGLSDKAVEISRLNDAIIADGTAEAIEEARQRMISGDWDVFAGPLKNSDGEIIVADGDIFIEPMSSPSWDHILEGVEIIGD